ncbi:MAG: phospholipid-binding lipoprotein MlaA [Motiliproteus sp.]|jgi:phospholipid-binding lipoprotein MlaA
MLKRNVQRLLLLLVLMPGAQSQAQAGTAEQDPWEGVNRQVFAFNDFLDRNLLLPVTRGYMRWVPQPIQTGVHNFFGNLDDVVSLFSNILQLKPHNSAQDFSRVVGNTIFGVLGFIDFSTALGIPKQHEEFGQVLGYWGMPSGPYVVLPFLGPSNVRDGLSRVPNSQLAPPYEVDKNRWYWSAQGLSLVDTRAGLTQSEGLISGDRYSFIRDAYMQRRAFLVNDGVQDAGFQDDGF